jgi:glycosyltransferase involved in cell wall biosynthesis
MRIAMFLGNAGRQAYGTETYEVELARAITRANTTDDFHFIFLSPDGPSAVRVQQPNVGIHVLRPSLRPVSMLTSLPLLLKKLNADLVHACFIPPPFPVRNLVYSLPCSSPFLFPQFFPPLIRWRLQFLFRLGMKTAHVIPCFSLALQQWVRKETGLPGERLPIIPLAASPIFGPGGEDLGRILFERYGIDYPYFLFSGRWEPRKNVLRLIEAFARFKQARRTPYKLVFSGARFYENGAADALIAKYRLSEEIVDLGKTPFSELPALYAGARALLFPSLWENFGLPIVEAMKCGTPVLTSTVASMPEVAGNAAVLVDPYSIDDIADGIDRLASDDSLCARLRTAGLERSLEFTWERTARLTMEVYRNCALNC